MKIYNATPGASIYHAAIEAISLAKTERAEVRLEFNDIYIYVSPFSYADDIATIYSLRAQLRRMESQ